MALVAGVASLGMSAADAVRTPRLLVNIVVDGLDADCLDLLRDCFGDGGFRRLERQGAVIVNADYGPGLDAAAATATVMTGASPSVTGIDGATRYDADRFRQVSAYNVTDEAGCFSPENYSPAALRVSTVADEIRMAAGGTNVVYAVAADPEAALPLGGHSPSSSMWMDIKDGHWVSSSYFPELPAAVRLRNLSHPLSGRLDTMSWTPVLEPDRYPALPAHLKRIPFRYTFAAGDDSRLARFNASPLANSEVSSVASDLLATSKIGGHDGVTDVLGLAFSLKPYEYGRNSDNRPEIMDAYIRLDRNLEQLFDDIDRRVGLDNTVIMLAATPPSPRRRRDDELWRIPAGEFSTRRAISLLNIYLIAVYGNGDYISAYHRGHLFFNHKFLKEHLIDADEVRRKAAGFLSKMTGVEHAYSIDDILAGRVGEVPEGLRRNTAASSAGDIVIQVAPGFEILDDYGVELPANRIRSVERAAGTTAPVFIMAPGIGAQTIGTPVDARAIASTVCRILRIRSPNGAAAAPLHLLKK